MHIIRIFFSKTGTAAYISHLDLQRVMSRALRQSNLPVWYSKGFNPHIYMSFALPLPLMQESLAETVDCKTESEEDLSVYLDRLNHALPQGLQASRIARPVSPVTEIAFAEYQLQYHISSARLAEIVDEYNRAESVMVIRKTKRSEAEIDLKKALSRITILPQQNTTMLVQLPAGGTQNYNPNLLSRYFSQTYSLPSPHILRVRVLTKKLSDFL